MKTFKKILKALLFLHPALLIMLTALSAALLVYSFVFLEEQGAINYISYALSAYTLTALCLSAPKIFAVFKRVKNENKYLKIYQNDVQLRVNISLYTSLFINAAYAIFQLGLGFYHHTVWYYSLAGYYIILGVMRFFLLKYTRKNKAGENKKLELLIYRFCGILLVLMHSALSVIVFYITMQGRVFAHSEITTIALAAYTFTSLTLAIINVVKYRKYESPVMSASKVVSLAAALVSLLTLESAMLNAFGDESDALFSRIMTGATGGAITFAILVIAIFMIIRSTRQINALKEKENVNTEEK